VRFGGSSTTDRIETGLRALSKAECTTQDTTLATIATNASASPGLHIGGSRS